MISTSCNYITLVFLLVLGSCGEQSSPKSNPTESKAFNFTDSIGQLDYFNSLTENDYENRQFWDTLVRYKENHLFGRTLHDSKAFNYLLAHRKEFEKKYTPDSVQSIICRSFEFTLKWASGDTARFKRIKEEIIAHTGDEAVRIFAHIAMANYYDKKDFVNYSNIAADYLDNYCLNEDDKLNWTAWQFYEQVADKNLLNKALLWSKRAIVLNDCYENKNTYAHLLYKLGKKEQAEPALKEAIIKAKEEKADCKSALELLNKIEADSR